MLKMRWAWSRPYTDDTARAKMRTHHSNRMIDLTSNAISLRQAASADWMFMVPSVRVGAPWEPKWIFKKGVARIERSEMRGDIAAHNGAPGLAPLNPGYSACSAWRRSALANAPACDCSGLYRSSKRNGQNVSAYTVGSKFFADKFRSAGIA